MCLRVVRLVLIGLLTLAAAASGSAAEPYDMRRFGGRGLQHGFQLLMNEPVQKEIGFTQKQQAKLLVLQGEYGRTVTELRGRVTEKPETAEQWEAYNRLMVEAYTNAWEKVWPGAQEILSESQERRLQEILVQCRGPAGLDDPWTSEKLALSETQKQSLAAIRNEHLRRLQDLFAEDNSRVPGDLQSEVPKLEKERDADCLLVLTDGQRTNFERLKGVPFDLKTVRNGPFANGVFGPPSKAAGGTLN